MKKVASLLLALIMILSLSACGSKGATSQKDDGNKEETENVGFEAGYDAFPEELQVKKISTIEKKSIYSHGTTGIIYKDDNGLYGIMNLDGSKETGAKYAVCDTLGDYFMVAKSDEKSMTDIKTLNSLGVVDVTGKEIVPMQYAAINKINERYLRVCEVTEQTTNKDEALVYYTERMFSLSAGDDDVLFKGTWYIYDVVTGEKLKDISGTQPYSVYGYGDFVKYMTDTKEQITVNHKGEVLPGGASLFENGYYTLTTDTTGAVYNSESKKLFDYDLDGFVPYESEDDYILARKYENDVRKYVYMDKNGKVISGEFPDAPILYGELVLAGEKVYNLQGEIVIEGNFTQMYIDKHIQKTWFLKNDKTYTLIKQDGTVLWSGTEDDTTSIDPYTYFSIAKKTDSTHSYYSLADKDFTIQGNCNAPWMVTVQKENYVFDVVDTISGKTIISNYSRYQFVTDNGNVTYVYAYAENGNIDIYAVK